MPGDKPADSGPAAQIEQALRHIKDRYGPDGPPEETEVTCAGGIQLPAIGASDGE